MDIVILIFTTLAAGLVMLWLYKVFGNTLQRANQNTARVTAAASTQVNM